jgi:hypothetical protein
MVFALVGIAIGCFIAWQMAKANKPTLNELLTCPHCQQRGGVMVSKVTRKKGISGGKATGAVLTGGLSVAATGLSRMEGVQHMRCTKCNVGWDVS